MDKSLSGTCNTSQGRSFQPLNAVEKTFYSDSVFWHITILILVSAALFLFRTASLPLMDPDESRCALITSEMIKTSQWLVPHLEGKIYFDKPAPFFWLAAFTTSVTGNIEPGGRLISAIAAIAAVLVTYFMARRMFNPLAGLLAGLILAVSMEFLFIARWYRMDMPFTAAMWAALWYFWRQDSLFALYGNITHRRLGTIGFYFFCAIATLFKGPAGLALPLIILVIYFILSGQTRRIFSLLYIPAILLYLLIVAPWYVIVSLREPSYAYEFFIHQNLIRYAGGKHGFGRSWPGILYLPILFGGMLPWSIYLPAAVVKFFPRKWKNRAQKPEILFLWLIAVFTLIFFAFSHTKMANYIIPAFPPLAVLIGAVIADWILRQDADKTPSKNEAVILAVFLMLLSVAAVVSEIWLKITDIWIIIPAAVFALSVWQLIVAIPKDLRKSFILSANIGIIIIFLFGIAHIAPALYECTSLRDLARLVPQKDASECKICFLGKEAMSFILYIGAPETYRFDDTAKSLKRLETLMSSQSRVYCVVNGSANLDILKKDLPSLVFTVGCQQDYWLVTNQLLSDKK